MDVKTHFSKFTNALHPENDLELHLLSIPEFVEGLQWGIPRYGHPEGEVYKHVQEVLWNIDHLKIGPLLRKDLRLIAFCHDTFKHVEDKNRKTGGGPHHGLLARHFMQQFDVPEYLLDIIEWHDEAYYCWRTASSTQHYAQGIARLHLFMQKLGDNLQLFYLFFKCDTRTGDKIQAPVKWFEKLAIGIEIQNW